MDTEWTEDLERWLAPFLSTLGHKARRRMCPLYIAGLIGPGDRKSIQPMAARGGEVGYDQLHHFVAAGVWDSAPLEAVLLRVLSDWGHRGQAASVFLSALRVARFRGSHASLRGRRLGHFSRPPHDGVRKVRRLNLFHDLEGWRRQALDSQRDRLAYRPHGNDAFPLRGTRFSVCLR